MTILDQISEPVKAELQTFNDEFKRSLHSDLHKLQEAIEHIMSAAGKHIRPLLLLLSARSLGNINTFTINSAVFLELLHTASLIHDDVIDETKVRRGKSSLNAIYDNRVSVLVGDYTLSTALARSIQSGNMEIIHIVSTLGCDLAEGELFQMEIADASVIDEDKYFKVIKRKTAALLSACMEIGAISVEADREMIDRFRQIGEYLGYAFQIRDDIFDYFNNDKQIGKPTGNDIREGKVTLPLLYALRSVDSAEKKEIYSLITSKNFTTPNVDRIIEFAKDHGGIEYAEKKMHDFQAKASELMHTIPDSDAKTSLFLLADYIINRNK